MLSELVNHKPVSGVGYIILLIATYSMAILKNSYAAPRKRVDETTVSSIEMQIRAWLERGGCWLCRYSHIKPVVSCYIVSCIHTTRHSLLIFFSTGRVHLQGLGSRVTMI